MKMIDVKMVYWSNLVVKTCSFRNINLCGAYVESSCSDSFAKVVPENAA